jgi:LmbE family N-acetylglucosaminyl deacetylase
MEFKRILILSPHTDDGELCAGGTIARFVEEKKDVFYVAFSSAEKSVPENYPKDILKVECKKATEILGIPARNIFLLDYEVRNFSSYRQKILEEIIKFKKDIAPDLVITPSQADIHQDHQVVSTESLRAFKTSSSIWGYEHPWNNLTFTTDIFVVLKKHHVMKKIKSLKQYHSQSNRPYFDEKYLYSLAYIRGRQINKPFAEAFELFRLFVK